jgi:hypothetical protein
MCPVRRSWTQFVAPAIHHYILLPGHHAKSGTPLLRIHQAQDFQWITGCCNGSLLDAKFLLLRDTQGCVNAMRTALRLPDPGRQESRDTVTFPVPPFFVLPRCILADGIPPNLLNSRYSPRSDCFSSLSVFCTCLPSPIVRRTHLFPILVKGLNSLFHPLRVLTNATIVCIALGSSVRVRC